MPRRSHKKSRTGCKECKGRHIKCDENKPKCVNCVTVGTSCSFQNYTPSWHPTPQSIPSQVASIRDHRGSRPATPSDASGSRSSAAFDPNLNLDHLELLHHWTIETCATTAPDVEHVELYRNLVVREALKFPFLMHQILAITALHLAGDAVPDRAAQYYHRATELQSAAMAGFKSHQTQIDENSAFALLVFSGTLGLHVLADRSRTYGLDNEHFLSHVLHTVRLMQGVRILVLEDWWEKIHGSPEVRPFMDFEHLEPPYDAPLAVKRLKQLIQHPEMLDPATVDAYNKAIDNMEWLYAICKIPHKTYKRVSIVMGWPVRSSTVYLNLVERRQPEALIILAYFALALHYYRWSWVIRDTGIRLFNAIEANLDSHWAEWLDWPKELIASSQEQDG